MSGQTYYIYISSNDGTNSYKKVASFSYYAPYKLGDVTGEGTINSADALEVLKHAAKLTELTGTKYLAANVQKDATLNSADAVKILKYAAKLITTWD